MKNTLLIGNIKNIDRFYNWLNVADEAFDVSLIISEGETVSCRFTCPVEPLSYTSSLRNEYDIIFVCSDFFEEILNVLLKLGFNTEIIKREQDICTYLSKSDRMDYYAEMIRNKCGYNNLKENVSIGAFSYGRISLADYEEGEHLTIGKYCSIAGGVIFMLGGEHRGDWCTTYPFNMFMNEFSYIEGHPKIKGDIVVGNDVWIGSHAKIMSGVHIGDGSIIGANALVNKDVEPYTVVGGVPAKVIKKRFDDTTIDTLKKIQWWNWDKEYIYDAIPLLQSNAIEELIEYYNKYVAPNKMS